MLLECPALYVQRKQYFSNVKSMLSDCIGLGQWEETFNNKTKLVQLILDSSKLPIFHIVGRICNNFQKNRAFYDKSMKLGTWLVDNKTKIIRVSAMPKMPSNGRHLVFPKWPPFFQLIHYNLIIYLQTSCFLQLVLLK